MARVLVAGCGYVGCALAARLVADAHEVWGLRRRPAGMPAGVQPISADLSAPRSLKEPLPDLDFAFYLVSPGGSDDPFYRTACVDGLRGLLQALDRQSRRLRRLFFASSTSVYAQRDGEWVDEGSRTSGSRPTTRRLLEGEALAQQAPIPVTRVRFAGIYGPRRTRLVDRVRSGNAVYRKSPPQWTNRIHRDDAAGALRHLMGLAAPESLYLGVDCEPATEQGVLEWLSGALGAPPPRPGPAGDAAGRGGESNKRCRNRRLLDSGYRFLYPSYREGYQAVLDELP